jgi:hypothetical protein
MRSKKKLDKQIDVLGDDAAFVVDNDDTTSDADVCARCGCTRIHHADGEGHCLIHVKACQRFQ